MPVEEFSLERPEFRPDVPKKILGSGQRVEEFRDDDIPSSGGDFGMMGKVERGIAIPAPGGRGSVTQLRATPSKSARSSDVQTPPPLARPLEKRAAAAPSQPPQDELAEIAGSLQTVSLTAEESPQAPPPPPKVAAPQVPQETEKEAGGLFASGLTPASALDQAMIEKYGIEWLEWTPETIWQTIRADFKTSIARINQEKISAAMLLHVSDSFWKHWDVFEKVVLAFSNVLPHFDRHQEITVGQMLHGVSQAHEIRKEAFEPEVLSYIAVRAREEGMLWLPSPLDMAQARLDELNPPEVQPIKKEVRERWDAFRGSDLKEVEFPEDVYGIHLARLAAIDLYLQSMANVGTSEEL